jgi:hypothetical protein
MSLPSLSIIIPSFNQGIYIERTLLSILKQEYAGPLEVIVSDGGSTDSTVKVLKKFPQLIWWSAPDKGFVDAVTKGLAVAKGELIAIQSSDDFYLKGAFAKAIPVLASDDRLGFVTGSDIRVGAAENQFLISPSPCATMLNPGALISDGFPVNQHCTFARRAAIDKVGGLRVGADRCADFDLWYRILHFYPARVLPDHLGGYQLHHAQRTQNRADLWLGSFRYAAESCEADPMYASRFVMTPKVKARWMKALEIYFLGAAGGDTGREESIRVARAVIESGAEWGPELVANAQRHINTMTAVPVVKTRPQQLMAKVKQNKIVRRMFNKPVIPETDPGDQPELMWWKAPNSG